MTTSRPFCTGLLGDTAARDYARKLGLFNAFAEPELRRALAGLALGPGMRVLDAGCGGGEALQWMSEVVGPQGVALGLDLSSAHLEVARRSLPDHVHLVQGDVAEPPLAPSSLDRIWCVNTINHCRDPLRGVHSLAALLRPGGRLALGQSTLLPEMFFAWDARLERLTNEAMRSYYRERYGVKERELSAVRAIAGLLRAAGLQEVSVQTQVVERLSPLAPRDRDYLLEVIFRGTWGDRLRPYMAAEDHDELQRLCEPASPAFALDRPDFHFLQTFSVASGSVPALN